jgi:hypothetical protein
MTKYILSFGGGINSAALFFLIQQEKLPLDEVVFADTGNELPETYNTVDKFEEVVEKEGKKFTRVRSTLAPSLYEYCYNTRYVPSRIMRDCTSKFKISPIRNYLRSEYGKQEKFVMYIGIATEEAHRMRTSEVSYITHSYPLIDYDISRTGCVNILKEKGFGEVCKSGCFFCPFTPRKKWVELLDRHPDLFDKAIALEENRRNPDCLLSSYPLKKIKESRRNQCKLMDFEHNCEVAGSCFL